MKLKLGLALLGAVGALTLPIAAQAQWWQQHPGYAQGIEDLRLAGWLIEHREPNDPVQASEERKAYETVHGTVLELEKATAVDGEHVHNQPPPGFQWGDHGGRLHRALDLLHKAHDEIAAEEDNPAARGFRDNAAMHIIYAARLVEAAIRDGHY